MERLNWIDITKTIAIFSVVLVHTYCNYQLSVCINGFIMPLFFIISGYLFSYERNPSYGKFVVKRFRQLVVPYLWINIVAYVGWLLVLRNYGDDADSATAWYSPLIGISVGLPSMLSHDVPLWSLLCFFMVEVIYYPLRKWVKSSVFAIIISLIVSFLISIVMQSDMKWLPLTLGPAITGLIFYGTGHLLSEKSQYSRMLFSYPMLIVSIVVFWVSIYYNSPIAFYICEYGHYLLFMLSSLSGSLIVITLAYKMNNLPSLRLIRFISVTTLMICGFHLLAFAAIKGVLLYGFSIPPQEVTDGIFRGVIFSIAAVMLTLPFAWFIRKYMRWLVDK